MKPHDMDDSFACSSCKLASLYNPKLLRIIHELVVGEAVCGASLKRKIFSSSSPPLVPTSYSIRMIIFIRLAEKKEGVEAQSIY